MLPILILKKFQIKDNGWYYEYDGKQKPVITKNDSDIKYKDGNGLNNQNYLMLYLLIMVPSWQNEMGNMISVKADNRDHEWLDPMLAKNKGKKL